MFTSIQMHGHTDSFLFVCRNLHNTNILVLRGDIVTRKSSVVDLQASFRNGSVEMQFTTVRGSLLLMKKIYIEKSQILITTVRYCGTLSMSSTRSNTYIICINQFFCLIILPLK